MRTPLSVPVYPFLSAVPETPQSKPHGGVFRHRGHCQWDFFANACTTHSLGHDLGRCITFGCWSGKSLAEESLGM